MAINFQINRIPCSVAPNPVHSEIAASNGAFRLFRWTAYTARENANWHNLAKVARDVFDCVSEIAQHQNYASLAERAQVGHATFKAITNATVIPFFLNMINVVAFKTTLPWEPTLKKAKEVMLLALSSTLVFRFTLGFTALATPLNYILLAHYSLGVAIEGYNWYQMRSIKQAFTPNRDTPTGITQAIHSESTLQNLRVIDAVASLAAQIFSQMYPQMKLVNATVGALGSVYSMSITCYHEMQVPWHFKLT